MALRCQSQDRCDDQTSAGWAVSSEKSSNCTSGVEFLPLSIALPTGDTVYVSYNGGDLEETQSGEAAGTLKSCNATAQPRPPLMNQH
jgi:hypothetical protein